MKGSAAFSKLLPPRTADPVTRCDRGRKARFGMGETCSSNFNSSLARSFASVTLIQPVAATVLVMTCSISDEVTVETEGERDVPSLRKVNANISLFAVIII